MDLIHLSKIAIKAASAAGKIIQEHMDDSVRIEHKKGGTSYASQVVTEVDQKCEATILSHLLPTCTEFDLALLSEETEDDLSRFEKEYFWCIDPMDGTLPFIHKNPGFSVSIALVRKDGTPLIGVVFDPTTNSIYHAIKDRGAYKNNEPWSIINTNKFLTYFTDKELKNTPNASVIEKILKDKIKDLALPKVKEISGAGAVMNAIYTLEHGPAIMLKLPKKENGGGSIWDFAATACIYKELGLPATNYNGGKLDLNRSDDTFMNHEGVVFANL